MIKKKQQEIFLENVEPFTNPKRSLEQYLTQVKDATDIIHEVWAQGDFDGKVVADLGCGTGMYSFGAYYCGANKVIGLEIDDDAIEVMNNSIVEATEAEQIKAGSIEVKKWDVNCPESQNIQEGISVDTVITNPPFGASKNEGIDVNFIEFADRICPNGNIYSIHKTSTRKVFF